ncbi:hypothetical protein OG21DRAFT_1423328, partial [Imleria badia]
PIRPRADKQQLSQSDKDLRDTTAKLHSIRRKALEDAVQKHIEDQKRALMRIAQDHSVTFQYISTLAGAQTSYRTSHKPQLQNALRHSLEEVREMVLQDPKMQNLTPEAKEEYIAALAQSRDVKQHGIHANNAAAARDVLATMDRISRELDSLREQTGIYATLFVTRGHVNDSVQAMWYGTDDSGTFWEDVVKHPALDVLRQYEQWACAQGQKLTTGKKNLCMNYENYNVSIVEMYGVQLVGWPPSITFTCPSKIGTVGEMRKLRDALRSGQCFWKRLSSSERTSFGTGLDMRRSTGEQVKKPRKKRSDAGKSRKRKAPGDATVDKEHPRKRKNGEASGAPKNVEVIGNTDDE